MAKQSQKAVVAKKEEEFGFLLVSGLKAKKHFMKDLREKGITPEIIYSALVIQNFSGEEKEQLRNYYFYFRNPEKVKSQLRAANIGTLADQISIVNSFDIEEIQWNESTLTWIGMSNIPPRKK